MIRAWRLAALLTVAATVMVSCGRSTSSGFSGTAADIYAGGPSVTSVRTLLGDSGWWAGAPSFEVAPLDSATLPATERFAVTQRWIHIGTAEHFTVTYTVFDTVTSATDVMTALKNRYSATTPSQHPGDDVLYLAGKTATDAAPYLARTYVRLGQIIVQMAWTRKDGRAPIQKQVNVAQEITNDLQRVVSGKAHSSPKAVDKTLLPPAGLDITYLGSVQLPIETWTVMLGFGLPGTILSEMQRLGATSDFAFGDYALNNDTHMEVQTALVTFPNALSAAAWFNEFAPVAPDDAGISGAYIKVAGGNPASGEYHYLFAAGDYGGTLICRASLSGEAASRECEDAMHNTALAWKAALGG